MIEKSEKQGLPNWTKFLWDENLIKQPKPRFYEICFSNHCNLNCSFCSQKELRKNNHEVMSLETLKGILKKAIEERVGIVITGGGESTLNPNFKEFVDILVKALNEDKITSLNLVTNGTMLDNCQHFIDKTSEPKSWIRISINSRLISKKLKLINFLKKNKGRCGLSFVYDDYASHQLCKFNKSILEGYAKFTRVRKAIKEPKEDYSFVDCVGHKYSRIYEVDGSIAWCCMARGKNGWPPAECPEGCRWMYVNPKEAWKFNPFS